jgi:serine/threonine protein phosphatase 1
MKTFVIGDIHGRRAQLDALLEMLPRDASTDTLVFLGDFIDRGPDAPGVVQHILDLKREGASERVVCLRGNHEQMILDFIANGTGLWLSHATGGERSFEQYTGEALSINSEADFQAAREKIRSSVPPAHMEFFRSLQLYHEDQYALYVHAGLDHGKHPRETDAHALLWTRDMDFFKNYRGKPCVFGHTPTPLLPLRGRLGRHGIYISHSAIGLDTGYNQHSPLSCLQLPDFNLYQAFADGHNAAHHITAFIPDTLRAMKSKAAGAGMMDESVTTQVE